MMFSRSTIAVLVSSLTSVTDLSSSCKGAVNSIASGSDGNCLNIGGLLGLATLTSSESIVPPVESWLKGFCDVVGTSPCSDAAIQSLANNIISACGSDLMNTGISPSVVSQIPSLVAQYYRLASQAICTRDTTSTTPFCVVSELDILQSSLGSNTNLTTYNFISATENVFTNDALVEQLACTTCAQGVYAIIRPKLESALQSDVDTEFNDLCGSGFATTTKPSQVVVATGALATQTGKTGQAGARMASPLITFISLGNPLAVVAGSVLVGAALAMV